MCLMLNKITFSRRRRRWTLLTGEEKEKEAFFTLKEKWEEVEKHD